MSNVYEWPKGASIRTADGVYKTLDGKVVGKDAVAMDSATPIVGKVTHDPAAILAELRQNPKFKRAEARAADAQLAKFVTGYAPVAIDESAMLEGLAAIAHNAEAEAFARGEEGAEPATTNDEDETDVTAAWVSWQEQQKQYWKDVRSRTTSLTSKTMQGNRK
jgi:hypothetical protein